MQATGVQSLGQEDSLEKGMATHSSILAWRIPLTEESGRLQSIGWQRVGHNWATKTFTCPQPGTRPSLPSPLPAEPGLPCPQKNFPLHTSAPKMPRAKCGEGRTWEVRSLLISRLEGFPERKDFSEGLEEYMTSFERAWGSSHPPEQTNWPSHARALGPNVDLLRANLGVVSEFSGHWSGRFKPFQSGLTW